MHMHAHAALTLFYKRLFFLAIFFFLIFPFSKTNFRYTIYHLFESQQYGSNTACWFIGKYGLSNAISEDPNEVTEFCGVS